MAGRGWGYRGMQVFSDSEVRDIAKYKITFQKHLKGMALRKSFNDQKHKAIKKKMAVEAIKRSLLRDQS